MKKIKIKIKGEEPTNKEALHQLLKKTLDFPDYYGCNLDALWDELTTIAKMTEIKILNQEVLIKNLGTYGEEVLNVFKEASEENCNLKLK